mmetsp:Transcript_80442/g.226139  ORF Transcript_80442/g.226139 Transcript_80442/m.226139 type:complete len:128 (-) Transcript_80442:328-711(-)
MPLPLAECHLLRLRLRLQFLLPLTLFRPFLLLLAQEFERDFERLLFSFLRRGEGELRALWLRLRLRLRLSPRLRSSRLRDGLRREREGLRREGRAATGLLVRPPPPPVFSPRPNCARVTVKAAPSSL